MNRAPLRPMSDGCLSVLLLAVAFLFMMTLAVFAHGDADWIRKGGYFGLGGSHCCGPNDCQPIPESEVTQLSDGYAVAQDRKFVPMSLVFDSQDDQFWVCWRKWLNERAIRCFFRPAPGS